MVPVGTEQHYKHLIEAIRYYERCGYKWLDVPWAVSNEAVSITRPAHVKGRGEAHYQAGGLDLYPVASAEQSFLQMRMDNPYLMGKYVTMTPCIRNEPVLDDLHQPYFLKVELINWDATGHEDMAKMIADARMLFEGDLWVDCVENNDPDPIGIEAWDLVTARTGIELGSYGIREAEGVGRWVYGTGLAEPRYSYALEAEARWEASNREGSTKSSAD